MNTTKRFRPQTKWNTFSNHLNVSSLILFILLAFVWGLHFYPDSILLVSWYTNGLFWSFIISQLSVYVITHFFWNLLFFVSFCYYSKQLLKVKNNRLQSYMDLGLNNHSIKVFKSLRAFDSIYTLFSRLVMSFVSSITFSDLLVMFSMSYMTNAMHCCEARLQYDNWLNCNCIDLIHLILIKFNKTIYFLNQYNHKIYNFNLI